jgi:hypothetical protein
LNEMKDEEKKFPDADKDVDKEIENAKKHKK